MSKKMDPPQVLDDELKSTLDRVARSAKGLIREAPVEMLQVCCCEKGAKKRKEKVSA